MTHLLKFENKLEKYIRTIDENEKDVKNFNFFISH